MAVRNRRKRDSDYVSPTCPPGWAWLLAGILIGAFISFLVYLREIAPRLPPQGAVVASQSSQPSTENTTATVSTPPPSNPAPDIGFYEIQPKTEEKVPPPPSEPPPATLKPKNDFPITVPGRYLLQVASFQNEQDAEGMKNYLVSLGIPAYVEKINLSSGAWYRVQVGPMTDLDKLNQIGAKLAENNLKANIRKY
jgi:cell division protein FtsN